MVRGETQSIRVKVLFFGRLKDVAGETEEIVALVATIKRLALPLVTLTGNLRSTLAAASDVVLDVGVREEACSLNLAPTAGQLCPGGFICRGASPFGDHPCQRLCLCRAAQPPEGVCAATP